jgi:hypothetical protein
LGVPACLVLLLRRIKSPEAFEEDNRLAEMGWVLPDRRRVPLHTPGCGFLVLSLRTLPGQSSSPGGGLDAREVSRETMICWI